MGRTPRGKSHLGDRFFRAREQLGCSQAELAKQLTENEIDGVYPSTIAKIEAGDRPPRIEEWIGLADLLNTSVDALLGRKVNSGTELAYVLRGVLNAAQHSAWQVRNIAATVDQALDDLEALDFDGRETLEADMNRARRGLIAAQGALTTAARFELPPRKRVALRKDLAVKETRTVYVAKESK